MTPKFRFFQARFSATLLRCVALAVALLVQASPARAEVVTLVCQNNAASQHPPLPVDSLFTLRINYDQKVVELLNSNGSARESAAARITESTVEWDSGKHPRFGGEVNRLSGEGVVVFPYWVGNLHTTSRMSGPCRRATQKF